MANIVEIMLCALVDRKKCALAVQYGVLAGAREMGVITERAINLVALGRRNRKSGQSFRRFKAVG